MKKTFFSLLLLISAGLMAQEQVQVLLLDSLVESSEYGLQSKQTFSYNNHGKATDWLVYNRMRLRGKEGVSLEFGLKAMAHNIKKTQTARA